MGMTVLLGESCLIHSRLLVQFLSRPKCHAILSALYRDAALPTPPCWGTRPASYCKACVPKSVGAVLKRLVTLLPDALLGLAFLLLL